MKSQKIQSLPIKIDNNIEVIFSDLDDTLTWEGKMHQETYMSLGALRKAGKKIVVVTGACAGWCDCIIRTWPIDCILGENGAFWLYLDENGNLIKQYQLPDDVRKKNYLKFTSYAEEIKQLFGIPLAQDQSFRITDIAFDINQEVKIDKDIVIKASNWLREKGLNVTASSIHINAWFGDYNKAKTSLSWLEKHGIKKEKSAFIGDSGNDEPMFEAFELTAGVANIAKVLDNLTHKPKYITHSNGGFGFVEFAHSLI